MSLRKVSKVYRTLVDFNGMTSTGFWIWGKNGERNADGTYKLDWGNVRPTVDVAGGFDQFHIISPDLKGWDSCGCVVHFKKTTHNSNVDFAAAGGIKIAARAIGLGGYVGKLDWGMGAGHEPPNVLHKNTSQASESGQISAQVGPRDGMVLNDVGMGQLDFLGAGDPRAGNGLGTMWKVGIAIYVFIDTSVVTEEVFEVSVPFYLGRK